MLCTGPGRAKASMANQGSFFKGRFPLSSLWSLLPSISSDSELKSYSSEKSSGLKKSSASVSGIKSRGSWISVITKSIKSSTECTKTLSGLLTTYLLCYFLRGCMRAKDNALICWA
jgi:hypothetical protein